MAKRKKRRRVSRVQGSAEERIMAGVRRVGFRSYRSYVVARSRSPLREMATELGIAESTFLNYHAEWVRVNAPAAKVELA
jgi:hypothetical protein